MKHVFRGATVLVAIVVCALAFVAGAHASQPRYGSITADMVKLREEPSTQCAVLEQLPINASVEVLSYENNWYRVLYMNGENALVGYVRSDLLFENSTDSRTAYVISDDALLRGGAGNTSYVVTTLDAGQAVKVKSLVGKWYFVVVGEKAGYVSIDSLSVSRPGSTSLERLLQQGMSGVEVTKLQQKLYKRGFLSVINVTGYYGSITRSAVAAFQAACNMANDGIAGDATIASIYDVENTVTCATAKYNQVKGTVQLLDWFKGGSTWLNRGAYFTITDVKTGLSFQARRFGGWFHADSEPVTAQDTVIMKEISGGQWSWNRRAVWVTYNGKTVAASIHTMPHMVNPTSSNNFDGHFCVHLLNSKVHATNRACPRHQACVMEAYNAGK